MKVGDEVLIPGKVLFVYADGVVQVKFERSDPMNQQIAFVEPQQFVIGKNPVLAAEAPKGTGEIIAILKSAIGNCVDEEPHKGIREKIWQAVEMVYRLRAGVQSELRGERA